jgi:hypothetical protein
MRLAREVTGDEDHLFAVLRSAGSRQETKQQAEE